MQSALRTRIPAGARAISGLANKPNAVPAAQKYFHQPGVHTYLKGDYATTFLYILGGSVVLGTPLLLRGMNNMIWGKDKRDPN